MLTYGVLSSGNTHVALSTMVGMLGQGWKGRVASCLSKEQRSYTPKKRPVFCEREHDNNPVELWWRAETTWRPHKCVPHHKCRHLLVHLSGTCRALAKHPTENPAFNSRRLSTCMTFGSRCKRRSLDTRVPRECLIKIG